MAVITSLILFCVQFSLIYMLQTYLGENLSKRMDFFSKQINFLLCERMELEYQAALENLEISHAGIQSLQHKSVHLESVYEATMESLMKASMEAKNVCKPYFVQNKNISFGLSAIGVELIQQQYFEEDPFRANHKVVFNQRRD